MMTGLSDYLYLPADFLRAVVIGLVLACVSGCSTVPRSDPPSYGDWRPDLSESVDRVNFSNLIDWQPLDRDWLLLRFNGGQSVALRPRDPCMGDVREARTMELLSAMSNLLHRSDQVRLDQHVCLIEEIRTVSPPIAGGVVRGSVYLSRGR